MFKKIMVSLDNSKVSQLALKTAIDFAKNQKAKLCMIHVIDYSSLVINGEGVDFEALRQQTKQEAESILSRSVKKAKKKRIKVEAKLVEPKSFAINTDIAGLLVKTAKNWRANLLVIGTHGYSGMSRFVLGSVTDEIIKLSSIPLLVIQEKKK